MAKNTTPKDPTPVGATPKDTIMPKKQPEKRALPIADDAANNAPGKAKTDKAKVPQSQNQALEDSTKKRKHRLDGSNKLSFRQAIDLTGDDDDDISVTKNKPAPTKTQKPATTKACSFKSDQRSQTDRAHGPGLPSASLPSASLPSASLPSASLPSASLPSASLPSASLPSASLPSTQTLDHNNGMAMSSQPPSPPDRSAKRAKCEDGPETNRCVTTQGIQEYHMAPPGSSAVEMRNGTRGTEQYNMGPAESAAINMSGTARGGMEQYHMGQPGSSMVNLRNNARGMERNHMKPSGPPALGMDNVATLSYARPNASHFKNEASSRDFCFGQRSYELDGNSLTVAAPISAAPISAAPTSATPASAAAAAAASSTTVAPLMLETDAPPRDPPRPTLTEKVKVSREFSTNFTLREAKSYQLLMRHNWNVDEAVLAHLGGGKEDENGNGNKETGKEN